MCDHHAGQVGQVLGELPRYYGELAEIMLPGQRVPSEDDVRVTTSKTRQLPINADARAAQEDMLRLLREIEGAYRPWRGWLFPPQPIGEVALVRYFAGFARAHLTGVLTLDVRFGVEVLTLGHRIRYLLGLNSATQRLALRCPSCDTPQLVRENGTGHATCKACGRATSETVYNLAAEVAGLPPLFALDEAG